LALPVTKENPKQDPVFRAGRKTFLDQVAGPDSCVNLVHVSSLSGVYRMLGGDRRPLQGGKHCKMTGAVALPLHP
jgi:hypothetical protein